MFDDTCYLLCHLASDFKNDFHKTLSSQNDSLSVPFRALLQRSFFQFLLPFPSAFSHICTNSSSCHNVFILLSLSGVTNLSLLAGVCAACMLAYKSLQMKWWAAVTVVAIPSQKALLMCPYVSSGKYLVLAPRCSCAFLHNLQITSDCCLIFASHLSTRMVSAIAIISRLLCLQGTRGLFKYFPKNALLSFCRNIEVRRPRAICRVIDIALLCPSSHT